MAITSAFQADDAGSIPVIPSNFFKLINHPEEFIAEQCLTFGDFCMSSFLLVSGGGIALGRGLWIWPSN